MQGWDEQPFQERDGGGKLTVATVQQTAKGDIDGTSEIRWVMAYTAEDRAEYVGVQSVDGTLGGRTGSFVLRSVGTFADGVAEAELTVVEGSGTGDLAGIRGTGSMRAPMGDAATVTLDYTLD